MAKGPKSIIVTVTDEMLGNIDQVADRLAAKGMKIDTGQTVEFML